MKPIHSILLATDFSDTANNALTYAMKMAETLQAKLYILHACRIPSASTAAYPSGYYEAVNMSELKLEAEKEMSELQHEFLLAPSFDYECITQLGPATEIIRQVAQEKQVDLIIMGTRKAEGLTEWLGSVTSDVVEHASCPVLAIPNNVRFKLPKKFLLTTTYSKESSLTALSQVKGIIKLFNAELDVLYIHPYQKDFTQSQALFQSALESYLEDIPHHMHTIAYDDVNEGIQKYIACNEVDVLTMIPQQHNFFSQLFRASKTRSMLFHTRTPLLVVRT